MFHKQSNFLNIAKVLSMALFFSLPVAADSGIDSFNYLQQGLSLYESGNYEAAINALSEAVKLDPDNSHYHHALAKAYGRLADKSGWYQAYKLSIKTREGLERAVELNSMNVEALRDLKKFYEQAPEFLGGGEEKAENIQKRLDELNASNRV